MTCMIKKLQESEGLDLHVALLYVFGLWPLAAGTKRNRIELTMRVYVTGALTFTILCGTIFFPMSIYTNWDEPSIVLEGINLIFLDTMILTKTGLFLLQPYRVMELVKKVQEMCKKIPDFPNRQRIEIKANTQRNTNKIVFYMIGLTTLNDLVCLSRVPYMMFHRRHYASIWLPLDTFASPIYESLMIFWALVMILMLPTLAIIDSFVEALLVQIVGQFRLLRHDFENIREDAVETVIRRRRKRQANLQKALARLDTDLKSTSRRPEELKANTKTNRRNFRQGKTSVVDCQNTSFEQEVNMEINCQFNKHVVRHNECIQLVLEVETVFHWIFFNQLAVNVGAAALGISYVAVLGQVDERTISSLLLVVFGYLELLAFCNLAEIIVEESDLVRDAVFSCDWLRASNAFKKSMCITMSRANQPLLMRVAGFVPLSQKTFLNIINLALTYYMALRTFTREEKSA